MAVVLLLMTPSVWSQGDEAGDNYERGIALYLDDRYEEAIQAFRQHLSANPRHGPSRDWIKLIESLEPERHRTPTRTSRPSTPKPAVKPKETRTAREPQAPLMVPKRKDQESRPAELPEIQPLTTGKWNANQLKRELRKTQSDHRAIQSEIHEIQQKIRERLRSWSE